VTADPCDPEVAGLLSWCGVLTRMMAEDGAQLERRSRERAEVVARLRDLGVPVAVIERATGASRAALLRHQPPTG
jgi:hypothetical protein